VVVLSTMSLHSARGSLRIVQPCADTLDVPPELSVYLLVEHISLKMGCRDLFMHFRQCFKYPFKRLAAKGFIG
jgi:hypothetical protein